MIAEGRIADLTVLLLIVIGTIYFIRQAIEGKTYKIRRLPALEALQDVVGRATEMGRPVHFSAGDGANLTSSLAPMTIAGLTILGELARMCARHGAQFFTTVKQTQIVPVMEDIVRSSYTMEGKPEQYRPDMVQFIATAQQAYVSGTMSLMRRKNIAGNVVIGPWMGAFILILEAGYDTGAITIAGTARSSQNPVATLADYFFISEELYAASALLSKDPRLMGTIRAQDIAKYISLAIIIIGSIFLTAGSSVIVDLLNM